MPTLKARIFSNHPENAASLAEALQQQGYQVEVVHPEASTASRADLEIALETCASADTLRRAAELAQDLDADVALASGTLTGASRPATEELSYQEAAPESDVASRLKASLPVSTGPGAMEGAAHKVAEHSTTAEQADSVPGFWAKAIPAAAVALSQWGTTAGEILASAGNQARESREHALTSLAQIRAEREEHLLELTHQRIEAEERAQNLVTARKNAVAYLQQLRDESAGRIQPASAALSRQESETEAAQRPWHGWLEKLRERVRPLRWDAALAGIASAGALFAIGLAVASFNSKPATSSGAEQSSAITSSPPPNATQQSSAAPSVPQPKPAVHARARKPSPAQRGKPARDGTAAASRDQTAANDVVIRHLASPTPTPKQTAQGWKHFSDRDH